MGEPTAGDDSGGPVGPVVFANATAREQLETHGVVVTFRKKDRTTGATWWRAARTGPKEGSCTIEKVEQVDPAEEDALQPYRPQSGFPSVAAWQAAIEQHHGGLAPGYVYRVTTGGEEAAADG